MLRLGRLWSLVALVAGAMLVAGCEQPKQVKKPKSGVEKPGDVDQAKPKSEEWSPERISKDPEGYCVYAKGLLADQLKTAEDKRSGAIEKRSGVAAQRDGFEANLEDVTNLLKRSRKAYEKATDEGRWPARFSGRSYTEQELKKLIVSTARYVDARKPLKDQYAATLRKLDKQVEEINQYIEKLRDQQDRLSLDLDRIKLAKEGDALADLNKTAFDIAAITENLLKDDSGGVDLEELIKADSEKLQEEDFLKGK